MPKDRGPGRNTWRGGRRRERRQHLPPLLSSPVPGSTPCFTCLVHLILTKSLRAWYARSCFTDGTTPGLSSDIPTGRNESTELWGKEGFPCGKMVERKRWRFLRACYITCLTQALHTLKKKKKKNSREVSIVTFRWENQSSERLVNLPKVTQGARNGVRNRAREATLWLQSDGVSRFEVRGNIVLK